MKLITICKLLAVELRSLSLHSYKDCGMRLFSKATGNPQVGAPYRNHDRYACHVMHSKHWHSSRNKTNINEALESSQCHIMTTTAYYYLLSRRINQDLDLIRFIMNQCHEPLLHHFTKLDLLQHERVSISTIIIYQLFSCCRPSKGSAHVPSS